MASLGGKTFDPTAHDTEQRDYPNLPDGIYRLEITSSDVKIDEAAGKMNLSVSIDVKEPEEFKGRKLFANYNLEHTNAQTQEIGQRQFASLCRALGIDKPVDESEELHLIEFTAKVGMGKDSKDKNADGSPKYAARNEIKVYYFPDQGEVPEPKVNAVPANDNRRSAAPAVRPQAAAAAAPKDRPWGKKAS